MITKSRYYQELDAAVRIVRDELDIPDGMEITTGIVLGTGWGDSLVTKSAKSVSLTRLKDGPDLEMIEGHERKIELGTIGGKEVLILRGRVHMNETTFNPDAVKFVRMQIEILLRLGVKNLILTCGAGGLRPDIAPGKVVFIDSFVSDNNETMPLFPGEFVSPESILDEAWITRARKIHLGTSKGAYVFFRGPHIEGIKHDKKNMYMRGGIAVGMSIKPECTVAALHPNVRVLALAHIMNSSTEVLDHIAHTAKAQENSDRLGKLLTEIVQQIHT